MICYLHCVVLCYNKLYDEIYKITNKRYILLRNLYKTILCFRLKGFMLAFRNPKLLSNLGEILYDSPFIHIDIEADFYLFHPMIGSFLKGELNIFASCCIN